MDSILNSVKQDLGGIPASVTNFDDSIIGEINSAFGILAQLGVGPKEAFTISSATDKWSDFSTDVNIISLVRQYVSACTKLSFDTPQSSAAIEVLNNKIKMLEFRLNIQCDRSSITDSE